MHLVHKVGGIAHAQGTPGVHVVLPAVDLLIVLEREVKPLLFGFEEQAVRLRVCPFNVRNVI
jgi:hypothetical protein